MSAPDGDVLVSIGKEEIEGFLKEKSDFALEMRVRKTLGDLGFAHLHSGTYSDPLTRKFRQYDIRALKTLEPNNHAWLAVECKNLRETSPLLIYTTKRAPSEDAFFLIKHERAPVCIPPLPNQPEQTWHKRTAIRIKGGPYQLGKAVGKSMDQVSMRKKGKFIHGDSEVFEKMSQALNSAHDLVAMALANKDQSSVHCVLPVVVVPDGRLWAVEYDLDGKIVGAPTPTDHVQYHVMEQVAFPPGIINDDTAFYLSHVEYVTHAGLAGLIEQYFDSDKASLPIFAVTGA